MEKQETGRAMFERFSESARRAIFCARFEAGREGAKAIEPEHILRGFLAEDQGDWAEIMASQWGERPLGTAHERPLPAPFLSQECASNLRQALVKSAGAGVAIADEVDMPVGMRSQQVIESAL